MFIHINIFMHKFRNTHMASFPRCTHFNKENTIFH